MYIVWWWFIAFSIHALMLLPFFGVMWCHLTNFVIFENIWSCKYHQKLLFSMLTIVLTVPGKSREGTSSYLLNDTGVKKMKWALPASRGSISSHE